MPWQTIDQDGENGKDRSTRYRLERMRLPHGWLVRSYFEMRERVNAPGVPPDVDTAANVSITFVPLGPPPWA